MQLRTGCEAVRPAASPPHIYKFSAFSFPCPWWFLDVISSSGRLTQHVRYQPRPQPTRLATVWRCKECLRERTYSHAWWHIVAYFAPPGFRPQKLAWCSSGRTMQSQISIRWSQRRKSKKRPAYSEATINKFPVMSPNKQTRAYQNKVTLNVQRKVCHR